VFQDLFGEMRDGRFVVKIDTEGYEQVIIRELAAAMPATARIAIVFENLQRDFDAPRFMRDSFGEGTALKLADNLDRIGSRLGKEVVKLTRGKVFRLTDQPTDWLGTVVLVTGAARSASVM
jgi:hypothetical protein